VVNFFEIFATRYLNSLRQDPMVGSQGKKIKKINTICNWDDNFVEIFVKHSHGPLGVKVLKNINIYSILKINK
jgi:hypothetical protein